MNEKGKTVTCDMCGQKVKIKNAIKDGAGEYLCRDCYFDIYGDEERFQWWRKGENEDAYL